MKGISIKFAQTSESSYTDIADLYAASNPANDPEKALIVGYWFQVIEGQGGYKWLDASPKTLAAKAHRPAYGSDGDYFSKPNTEDVIEAVRAVMAE